MSNIQLNIGDKIGFAQLASNVDGADAINFYPVVEVTTRDGERAYKYQFPNGEKSSAAITQSALQYHPVELQPSGNPKMICLNNRKDEFRAAMKRGLSSEMDVYNDFERDAFVVVNRTNATEYRVSLEMRGGSAFAVCGCGDFQFRRHVCKHIGEVLTETFFGVVESFGANFEA